MRFIDGQGRYAQDLTSKTEKDIIEDNSNFIVINKKSGLPVQGGTKVKENLINILFSFTTTI